MPSPFPGVDPYLEAQEYWEEFHGKFINCLQEALGAVLPDPYEVRMEERISLVLSPRPYRPEQRKPDVSVLRREVRGTTQVVSSSTSTITPVTIPLVTHIVEEVREYRLEVRRRPGRTLVAAIELLSPSNKVPPGRKEYEVKRLELIDQPVHLVEIDLLSEGSRLPMGERLPTGDYFAYVSRAELRPACDVYAWTVREPLPTIPLPLAAPDPDAPLDLAAVFATAYERGRYDRVIDYSGPLNIPLGANRLWAEERARSAIAR